MVSESLEAAEKLGRFGLNPWVINMRSLKPLDREILHQLAEEKVDLVTVEEHTLQGGFGSAVQEAWQEEGLPPTRVLSLGIHDQFVEHGAREVILQRLGLDSEGIIKSIASFAGVRVAYSAVAG